MACDERLADATRDDLPQINEAIAHWERWCGNQFLVLLESKEGQWLEALKKARDRLTDPADSRDDCGNDDDTDVMDTDE